jgi:hypothetical protein
MCPKGDDPETIGQTTRKIIVTTSVTAGTLTGTVKVSFAGYTASFDANPANTDSATCTTAFTALENVQTATCTKGATANGGAPYTISFDKFPDYPVQDNVHNHNGNPELTQFTCDMSSMTGTGKACAITDGNQAADSIAEYEFCSRRGTCNFASGECICKLGYTGIACNLRTNRVATSDSLPAYEIAPQGSAFTGDALKIATMRSASSAFDFIEADAGGTSMFTVRGDGLVSVQKLLAGTGGIVSAGGVTVTAGGVQVTTGESTFTNTVNADTLTLTNSLSTGFTNDILTLSTTQAAGANFNFLKVQANNVVSSTPFYFLKGVS